MFCMESFNREARKGPGKLRIKATSQTQFSYFEILQKDGFEIEMYFYGEVPSNNRSTV